MKSTSETGHAKNISNFESLTSFCIGYGSNYNPSNDDLKITSLTLLHTNAVNSNSLVKTTEATFNDMEGKRMIVFKPVKSIATRILAALKGAQPPATVIADAKSINMKIQGKRVDKSTKPLAPGETEPNQISVSQQSYDFQIDHFDKFVDLVSIEPKYDPNENDLTVTGLNSLKTQLISSNTNVKNAYVTYSNARIARNHVLYNSHDGLTTRAFLVKAYVKSVFGASSPEYKQISKLHFRYYEIP